MAYTNETKGARAIHLTNGTMVLVEAGATVDIDEGKVRRLAPGLVKAKNKVPPVPKDLAARFDNDGDGAPGGSKKQSGTDMQALRAEYKAKVGKNAFSGWDEATLREKMAAAAKP